MRAVLDSDKLGRWNPEQGLCSVNTGLTNAPIKLNGHQLRTSNVIAQLPVLNGPQQYVSSQ
jgi:hypothetical protein